MGAPQFPLAIHWPDYTDEQRCYIRQDVADELYSAVESLLPNVHTGPRNDARDIAHWERERELGNGFAPTVLAAYAALAKARGEQ